ncbi:MAG: hypothetical protein E4G89_04940 [Methanothrix sp.]|nr:MAG: hypothetical protein E4G89_04940 [Methanothrix sp.]
MTNSKGKGKAALTMIEPTSFYSNDSEKIKLNWFCYELSMGIYDNMRDDLGYRLKRHKISDEVLADFSICTSKKLKDIILRQLSGKDKKVCISYELIESYFPNLDDRLINKMLNVLYKAWDENLSFCEACPNRCISEKDEYCTLFDDKDLFR